MQYDFYNIAQFPRVIGVIDCIHVPIKSPWGDDAELFRNRKGWHSINVQVIGDSQLLIRNIVARWSGSTHDSRIFDNCHQKVELEQNPMFQRHVILGDAGYPCRTYLLTPFCNPNDNAECRYNLAHIQTRNNVERLFGVLKRRFPCLSKGILTKMDSTLSIIVATAVLHNLARRFDIPLPDDNQDLLIDNHGQTVLAMSSPHGMAYRRAVIQQYFTM